MRVPQRPLSIELPTGSITSESLERREKNVFHRAVFVAQVVERSLLTPDIRGSIPVIGKFLFCIKRRKKKEAVSEQFKKCLLSINVIRI